MTNDIKTILESVDLEGFTAPIKGELKRYVVGLTMNTNADLEVLQAQASSFSSLESVTIWGRTDTATQTNYIDIGTTLSNEQEALTLAKIFWQIAILDLQEMQEIRVA